MTSITTAIAIPTATIGAFLYISYPHLCLDIHPNRGGAVRIRDLSEGARAEAEKFTDKQVSAAVDKAEDGKAGTMVAGVLDLLQEVLPQHGISPFVAHAKSTGFIFNRIWATIKRESLTVVVDGMSTPEDIDQMWKVRWGSPFGPFEFMDHVVRLDIRCLAPIDHQDRERGPSIMLKTSVIEGTNVVSVTVDGSVSADEDMAARKAFVDVASEHGNARMLLDYVGVDLSRVEPRAVWEDLMGSRLLGVIDRIGVVSDNSTLDKFAETIGAVSQLEVHTYGADQRDAAVAWLAS